MFFYYVLSLFNLVLVQLHLLSYLLRFHIISLVIHLSLHHRHRHCHCHCHRHRHRHRHCHRHRHRHHCSQIILFLFPFFIPRYHTIVWQHDGP